MEDPDILIDLRHVNTNGSDKYEVFWMHCRAFLDECTAVHERRHESVTYMAKAISVRDLVEQVGKNVLRGHQFHRNSGLDYNSVPRTHEQR